MSHANMTIEFWVEAINTAAYLRNRRPTVAVKGATSQDCLFGIRSQTCPILEFSAVQHFPTINPEKQRKKFDEKSRKVVFVGYPEGTKGYKLYDPSTRKFIRSRDVVFVERKFHNVDTSSTEFYLPVDDTPQAVAVGDHDESAQVARKCVLF